MREEKTNTDAPGGVKYYRAETDDFVESNCQNAGLPKRYKWIHHNIIYRFCSTAFYSVSTIVVFLYTRLALHVTVKNKRVMRKWKGGCFLYGNHTQPIGDAFSPARYAFPKRIYTVISTANLGIPVLGKFLPFLGGIVIPESSADMHEFVDAIGYHIHRKRCVVIYPEAHVWPWCTFVRPFPETSFCYPVRFSAPAFCMTTTYQKPRHSKKPRVVTYLDGPFYPDTSLKKKEAQKKLYDEIFACMQERSKNSNYAYVRYVRESDL